MLPFDVVSINEGRACALAADEQVFGFHSRFDSSESKTKWIAVACTLSTPVETTISIGLFWGENWLNGEPLELVNDDECGNREYALAHLKPGVNVLYSEIECCFQSWGYQVGIPKDAGVELRALPDAEERLLVSAQMNAADRPSLNGRIPETLPELRGLKELVPFAGGWSSQFPARENGWARPCGELSPVDLSDGFDFPLETTGKAALVMDYRSVFTGHPFVEVECAESAVIDISYSELLRPCGLSDSYRCHHLVNSTDRYVVEPGRHTVEVFPERGGRYLQVSVISDGPVRLERVAIRLTTQPASGRIAPLDRAPQSYKKIVALCERTLLAGYAECFTDSPWREQGMYLGDHYVQYLAMRCLLADEKVMLRALRLYADFRFADGLLPAVCPGANDRPLADFTLIWILLLEEWALRSGDLAALEELWPEVEKTLAAEGFIRQGPLVGGKSVFVCWGIYTPARGNGGLSAALSAFYAGALEASARMARLLGREARACELDAERAALQQAYLTAFWDASQDAVAPVPEGHEARGIYSCHVNILALLYGLVPADRKDAVLNRIESELRRQLTTTETATKFGGHVEYYFLFYTFRLLARENRHALIEEIIDVLYGLMLDRDEPTLWENYCTGLAGQESHCHGWSSAPLIYFSEELLGVKYPDPLHPDRVSIRPASGTLTSCSGIYPHARGNIEIAWNLEGDMFNLNVTAPSGVEIVDAGPGSIFADMQSSVTLSS
jgi:hypothetical protein